MEPIKELIIADPTIELYSTRDLLNRLQLLYPENKTQIIWREEDKYLDIKGEENGRYTIRSKKELN